MKAPLTKPIRRLFFQFGSLLASPRLDAWQLFEALEDAGLVRLRISARSEPQPTHYVETKRLRSLAPADLLPEVRKALSTFVRTKLRLPPVFALPIIQGPRLDSQEEWHGFLSADQLEPWMLRELGLRADSDEGIRIEGTLTVEGVRDDHYLECDEEAWLSRDSLGSGAPSVKVRLSSFAGDALEEELACQFPYCDYFDGKDQLAADALYDQWKDEQLFSGGDE